MGYSELAQATLRITLQGDDDHKAKTAVLAAVLVIKGYRVRTNSLPGMEGGYPDLTGERPDRFIDGPHRKNGLFVLNVECVITNDPTPLWKERGLHFPNLYVFYLLGKSLDETFEEAMRVIP